MEFGLEDGMVGWGFMVVLSGLKDLMAAMGAEFISLVNGLAALGTEFYLTVGCDCC